MATVDDNGDDNFDIDIYGDGDGDEENPEHGEEQERNVEAELPEITSAEGAHVEHEDSSSPSLIADDPVPQPRASTTFQVASHPKSDSEPHGIKRKESSDERKVDPGSTSALMISELFWWITEDDVRGWVNAAGCEDEIKDITFNEHKVNGKSKGWVELFPRGLNSANSSLDRSMWSLRPHKPRHWQNIKSSRYPMTSRMRGSSPWYSRITARILSERCQKMHQREGRTLLREVLPTFRPVHNQTISGVVVEAFTAVDRTTKIAASQALALVASTRPEVIRIRVSETTLVASIGET